MIYRKNLSKCANQFGSSPGKAKYSELMLKSIISHFKECHEDLIINLLTP
jgi:hypothetical protein